MFSFDNRSYSLFEKKFVAGYQFMKVDHYRKKCPVYFNGKNPGLYKWRDQQAVHSVYFNGSSVLSACQSSNRNSGYEGSVQGDDAVKHFRLDYALDRPDDLCADVCSRNHYIRNRGLAGISESEEYSYG